MADTEEAGDDEQARAKAKAMASLATHPPKPLTVAAKTRAVTAGSGRTVSWKQQQH